MINVAPRAGQMKLKMNRAASKNWCKVMLFMSDVGLRGWWWGNARIILWCSYQIYMRIISIWFAQMFQSIFQCSNAALAVSLFPFIVCLLQIINVSRFRTRATCLCHLSFSVPAECSIKVSFDGTNSICITTIHHALELMQKIIDLALILRNACHNRFVLFHDAM